jgi:hypothetical protein
MTAPRTIRINRLVIEGIDSHQRAEFAAAFTAELARLLRDHPDSVPRPRPDPPTASVSDLGRSTAAAVHARVVRAC